MTVSVVVVVQGLPASELPRDGKDPSVSVGEAEIGRRVVVDGEAAVAKIRE